MKRIPLTQGQVALVDDADYKRANQFKWHAHKSKCTFYAAREVAGKLVYLHRYLLGASNQQKVDHEDGDGLDCTRKNIRLCSHQQNMHGFRRKKNGASSQYHGVHWAEHAQKWRASIRENRKLTHLGYFHSEKAAAGAYDTAALARDPNFFNLNKV